MLQDDSKQFTRVCSYIFQQELAKYNQDESKKMREELMQQMKQMTEQHNLVIKQYQQREEERIAQEEERKKRRKRDVYNPRFANKNCWHCGIAGHLIYWCPELYY